MATKQRTEQEQSLIYRREHFLDEGFTRKQAVELAARVHEAPLSTVDRMRDAGLTNEEIFRILG